MRQHPHITGDDGYETRTVVVSLDEVIHRDGEEFLDLLDLLFFAEEDEETRGYLSDIAYRVTGVNAEGALRIAVTAYVEREGEEGSA